ncbi:hypothetical protein [Dyella acidisoli]|uniref:SMI1/KNR4 family protein n=1 Tax=Dyella acidisoli TaxID=1867834 RepID=A0ABQ5XIQ8_9GAMM|nr:hypothetical protein [Dyella acidisoli]GLQ91066.1 hypothetical protein GCM10007901_00160 [Dyella acidisoli]
MQSNVKECSEMIMEGVGLPSYVFTKRFRSHLFFASGLGHPELTEAIRELVTPCLGPGTRVAVFSTYTHAFLGWLEVADDWQTLVEGMIQRMRGEGDHGGMLWVDAAGRLAVYQWQPVDLGIVALDAHVDWHVALNESGDPYFATDYFFDVAALELLLADKSERGLSLAHSSGREFLEELARSYA